MTTLYKPVLIETAEQAEALPDGAVLVREGHFAFQKHAGRFVSADPHDLPVAHAWEVVGWTALVPIEAEEETATVVSPGGPYPNASMDSDGDVWLWDGPITVDVTNEFNEWARKNTRTRYVTPWTEEEA